MTYHRLCNQNNTTDVTSGAAQIQVKEQQFYFSIVKAEFEDTEGVIRIRKSKKNRQHNCQKKKDKRRNNDLQNTMY
jgi:adenylate cyclase class IV